MSKRATLAQVAAFAGVSIATASRCFSNPELDCRFPGSA